MLKKIKVCGYTGAIIDRQAQIASVYKRVNVTDLKCHLSKSVIQDLGKGCTDIFKQD